MKISLLSLQLHSPKSAVQDPQMWSATRTGYKLMVWLQLVTVLHDEIT